jgi:coenzyme F420 biosynthesis associated uncharacterized protein
VASSEIIDWGLAARIGRTIGGPGPATTPHARAAMRGQMTELSARSDALVREFTGLVPAGPALEPAVLDRGGWVRANLEGFQAVLRPLSALLSERVRSTGLGRRVASAGLAVQIGVLLGYLSKKVLGQYDLVLATEGAGRVYYVGPNIIEAERRWNLDPGDFRLWIALHEITHRTQFTAVPWLREKARGLMHESLSSLELDPERVKRIIAKGRDLLLGGPSAWQRASLMDLVLSDDQRAVIGQMQSLMTIVEGHGSFVMNRVGAQQIDSFDRLHAALHGRRRTARGAERAFQRAIGMDMKYEQYELGERFMNAVAERAGTLAVNAVWEAEENLPTADELRDPDAWLRRVGG